LTYLYDKSAFTSGKKHETIWLGLLLRIFQKKFKAEINKYNLLPHIKVIHLNDSKNDLGNHKDRHANIEKGYIGIDTLAKFVHDSDFDNIPIILETPWV
ncbi:TIM barrel protein, partial [Mycoplasmopsis bovis]|uniref:TIM barrel protein n=1 Tax=Mycoplasmopsis bovis TaxID=28903 RepID=UPI003D287A6B